MQCDIEKNRPVAAGKFFYCMGTGQQKIDAGMMLHEATQILKQFRIKPPFFDLRLHNLKLINKDDDFLIYELCFCLVQKLIKSKSCLLDQILLFWAFQA